MAERTLSTGELNRALLDRQMLLRRAWLSIPEALERMGGLQNQYAPSGYIGLWSRLHAFSRNDLTAALLERSVVQGTLMRATIHLVSAADYPLFAAATRRAREEWWRRVQGRAAEGVDMAAAAALVRGLLATGPRRHADLLAALEEAGFPRLAWSGVGAFVDLVRVPPSGTWERRRADLYGLAEDWLGTSPATEGEGLAHIIRRYLGAFGPAPVADIATWSGVPAGWLKPVAEGLGLVRYRDESGGTLLDVRGHEVPDADTRAPVRFLPTWDALLLVHARRTGVLPEEHRQAIFSSRTPHSFPTFLLGGRVAGTWRHAEGRVRIEAFAGLPAPARSELDKEAQRLAVLFAA
jgi:hypothetical protein